MVKPSKGPLSGNSRKLRGKSIASVAQAVRTFNVGEKVLIAPKSTSKGQPHLRYANRHGVIKAKRGKAYEVEIGDYKKKKTLIVGAVHLKVAQ